MGFQSVNMKEHNYDGPLLDNKGWRCAIYTMLRTLSLLYTEKNGVILT